MTQNPFDYFQNLMNTTNFNKMMPNMDVANFSNTVKNMTDALSAANHAASENLQNAWQKGAQNLQKNTTQAYNTMKDSISAGDINQLNNTQQQYFKEMMNTNLQTAREFIESSTRTTMEMLNTMQNSFNQAATATANAAGDVARDAARNFNPNSVKK